METKAILKYARITPRKARRVTKLISGKKASDAMVYLKLMPYRGAKIIEKVLKSAMSNAEKFETLNPEDMIIKTALVNEGPMMKRLMPRAMGRANIIKKKTSHITLVLTE
ncbi:Ribosomal protein L22, bacterial-type [Candidatus Magnetoovum chiemensis]|nr:Ribosomal protein L22, bacterial-type [Candidatus Magnetoovum chiemensis]